MPEVLAAYASGKIDVTIAIDIFENGTLCPRNVKRCCLGETARHRRVTAIRESPRLRSWDLSLQLNRRHLSTTQLELR
jgi:hypothetical protein